MEIRRSVGRESWPVRSGSSPLNGERVGVRGGKNRGARLLLRLMVVLVRTISTVRREVGSRGWEHPSPSFPLPVEGRGRSEACALAQYPVRMLASRQGDVGGARVAEMAKRFTRRQALPTPSPLNGERVGVRGGNARGVCWMSTVCGVSAEPFLVGNGSFGRRGLAHPSPSFPLPVEGRGRSEARAWMGASVGTPTLAPLGRCSGYSQCRFS